MAFTFIATVWSAIMAAKYRASLCYGVLTNKNWEGEIKGKGDSVKIFLPGNINISDYTKKLEILSGSTVGQHMRHILEFYLLLVTGSSDGIISYDRRERDIRIENNISFALSTADRLLLDIETLELSESVKLDADYTNDGTSQNLIKSTIGRELAYCIEHSIHHQAIIKAGLFTMELSDLVNEHFGVAYSTIRYRNNVCAQ